MYLDEMEELNQSFLLAQSEFRKKREKSNFNKQNENSMDLLAKNNVIVIEDGSLVSSRLESSPAPVRD